MSAADACLPTIIHLAAASLLIEDFLEICTTDEFSLSPLLPFAVAIVTISDDEEAAPCNGCEENSSLTGVGSFIGTDSVASGGIPTSSSRLLLSPALLVDMVLGENN